MKRANRKGPPVQILHKTLYYREFFQGLLDLLFRIFIVHEFSCQEVLIGSHIKISVTAEIEEYRLLFAFFFCLHRLVYRPLDRMCAFRRRDYALCFCEFYRSLKDTCLAEATASISLS